MRRMMLLAAIFSAGFLARGLWNGSAVQADGNGHGTGEPSGNGDVNGDGSINLSDAVYMLNWLFRGGPGPVPIECEPPAGKGLPDTGQTKCWGIVEDQGWSEAPCVEAACPGQDGAYATACPSEGRFVDNQDGTVTDTCTGLMWQKDTADVNGNGTFETEVDRLSWCEALAYCEGLDFAGYDDWRLPNVRELQSIVDYGRWVPAIDPIFEFGTFSDWYWSSTSYAGAPAFAWFVYFYDGGVYGFNIDKATAYLVRAVRNAD